MDVDPNYDPSDFLMSGLPKLKAEEVTLVDAVGKIDDDLAVSESDEENNTMHVGEEDDPGELWF